jgi:hypothetical protein
MIFYIGIDNGVSGSIGVITGDGVALLFQRMPTFKDLNYTKKKSKITRIDTRALRLILQVLRDTDEAADFRVFLERPMINPGRFKATVSAIRALEATLVVVERFKWSVQYVDSREWQSVMLPKGSKAKALKKDSIFVGCRRFPKFKAIIKKQKDADGLLIAEAMRSLKR